MSEPALKCENNSQLVFSKTKISDCVFLLKWTILVVQLRGKSRFSKFPTKKSFITSTTGEDLTNFHLINIHTRAKILIVQLFLINYYKMSSHLRSQSFFLQNNFCSLDGSPVLSVPHQSTDMLVPKVIYQVRLMN